MVNPSDMSTAADQSVRPKKWLILLLLLVLVAAGYMLQQEHARRVALENTISAVQRSVQREACLFLETGSYEDVVRMREQCYVMNLVSSDNGICKLLAALTSSPDYFASITEEDRLEIAGLLRTAADLPVREGEAYIMEAFLLLNKYPPVP